MSNVSYVSERRAKTGLHLSRQVLRRTALALAGALAVAGAADFGHYYLTTGRYLETTVDACVKPVSRLIAPRVFAMTAEMAISS